VLFHFALNAGRNYRILSFTYHPLGQDYYLAPVNFEEYLLSKKIDKDAFLEAESSLYNEWKAEFEQMHPNSFTVQKLNLINPVRRKYQLKEPVAPPVEKPAAAPSASVPAAKPGKPVMKPKPKF
jgi:hypothetical protein